MSWLNFFQKKSKPESKGLELAKEKNLITQEEFLKLKITRAEEEYKNYQDKKKPKAKRIIKRRIIKRK